MLRESRGYCCPEARRQVTEYERSEVVREWLAYPRSKECRSGPSPSKCRRYDSDRSRPPLLQLLWSKTNVGSATRRLRLRLGSLPREQQKSGRTVPPTPDAGVGVDVMEYC